MATASESEGSELNEEYKAEIREAFKVFDTERTGLISPNSLKILLRALGYRATRQDVAFELERLDQQRRKSARVKNSGGICYDVDSAAVDIEVAYAVVARKWANRDPKVEMKMNFRLFTDTGHITEDNLRRVALELGEDAGRVGDDQIRAMIDAFDSDLDGKISFAEFRRIMTPLE